LIILIILIILINYLYKTIIKNNIAFGRFK